jgi:hypothetical protein
MLVQRKNNFGTLCASGFKFVEAGILVKGKSGINIILSFNIVHCCYSHFG